MVTRYRYPLLIAGVLFFSQWALAASIDGRVRSERRQGDPRGPGHPDPRRRPVLRDRVQQ